MNFFKSDKVNLLDFVKEPSMPWQNRIIIPAAGIIASGWTHDDKIFLLSSDGYSVSNSLTGEREIRNYDEDNSAMQKFSKDNLEFTIDELNQTIKVFGLRGGDGNYFTSDFWNLTSFSPSLHEQVIGLQNIKTKRNHTEHWKNFELISLQRLEYSDLKFGFSPNEKHFGIIGSGGAEIFSRD